MRRMKTHVVLHLVMDWEFGKSELTNLLEECDLMRKWGYNDYAVVDVDELKCLLITQEPENKC